MMTKWFFGAALLTSFLMTACGGGGGGGGGNVAPALPAATPTPAPLQQVSATFSVQAAPTAVPMPEVSGFSAILNFPGVTGDGTITVTLSPQRPAGVMPLSREVRMASKQSRSQSTAASALLYVAVVSSSDVTLRGIPGFTVTVPPSIDLRGNNYYMSEPESSFGWAAVSGPAVASGSTITMPADPNAPSLDLTAGVPEYFAIAGTGIAALTFGLTPNLTIGTPITAAMTVQPWDAFSMQISGSLPQPINISSDDSSGQISLSSKSISNTIQSIPVVYSGRGDNFTLTVTYGNISTKQNFVTTFPKERILTGNAQAAVYEMLLGPDGNFWWTFSSGLAKVTPTGQFTYLADPSPSHWSDTAASAIVLGSDGNVWYPYHDSFSEDNGINRVTPSGQFTSFPFAGAFQYGSAGASSMVLGPDGAIWFGAGSPDVGSAGIGIGRIDTAGNISQIATLANAPTNLLVGPDKNLWFSEGGSVDKMTLSGVITTYTLPIPNPSGSPLRFKVGPDGNFWAPYAYGSTTLLKFSTSGTIVSTSTLTYNTPWDPSVGGSWPSFSEMTSDGSGNIYITDDNTQGIIRVTPDGTESEYPVYSTLTDIVQGEPLYLAMGGDGRLYVGSMAFTSFTSPLLGALTPIDLSYW